MNNQDQPSCQLAEYAMALDLTSQLTQERDEEKVLHRILELFTILFAPQQVVFWVMQEGSTRKTLTTPGSMAGPSPLPDSYGDLPETTPAGFRLRIPWKEETVGIIHVDGLAFPEYRERYLSLALAIAGVCGLAVANARAHSRLEVALSDLRAEYARSTGLSRELQAANEELEDRVRKRTAELETAMVQLREEVRQRTAAEEIIHGQLDEKILLLRELHHRVRNNLQLITSMISIQARKVPDPALQSALSETKNRIRTMAVIHERLWNAQDMSRIDLNGLVRQIPPALLSQYRVRPDMITISMNIAPVAVDINTAIPLALVLNELFSNSLKHAFPGGRRGEILLEIRDERDGIALHYADNGIGLSAGYDWENADTVGLILITSLIQQLQGSIEREAGCGTGFLIRLPKASGEPGSLRGTYNRVQE